MRVFETLVTVTVPCDAGELEKPEKIEQVSESSDTPLRFDFSKPKRNDKESQHQTQPIKIVVGILEIAFPFPGEIKKKDDLLLYKLPKYVLPYLQGSS